MKAKPPAGPGTTEVEWSFVGPVYALRLPLKQKPETIAVVFGTALPPADFPIKLVVVTVAPTTAVEVGIKVAVIVACSLLVWNSLVTTNQRMTQLPNNPNVTTMPNQYQNT